MAQRHRNIALISIPRRQVNIPCPACAILSGVLRDAGLKTTIYDLPLDLDVSGFDTSLVEDWATQRQDDTHFVEIKKYVKDYIDDVLQTKPDLIALSILSFHSHVIAEFILKYIKTKTNIPTIIGGAGVGAAPSIGKGNIWRSFSKDDKDTFAMYCIENNLTDYFLMGDSELEFKKFCLGEHTEYLNKNTLVALEDLNEPAYPDYSDWKKYDEDFPVSIVGSRGCVRKCTFCDVAKLWPVFKYRTAENIFYEMLHHKETLGVTDFNFTDSLVNGSYEYKKFIKLLAEYNRETQDKITWSAQVIIRKKNWMKQEDFDNLRDSGCKKLYIGIESGSEKVRDHMLKKFNNDDMYYELENILSRGIYVVSLMIVGYPTETYNDFLQTKEYVKRLSKYKDNILMSFSLMQINPGTPVYYMEDMWYNELTDGETDWKSDIAGDYKQRLQRWVEIYLYAFSLGYRYENFTRQRVKAIIKTLDESMFNDETLDLIRETVDLAA